MLRVLCVASLLFAVQSFEMAVTPQGITTGVVRRMAQKSATDAEDAATEMTVGRVPMGVVRKTRHGSASPIAADGQCVFDGSSSFLEVQAQGTTIKKEDLHTLAVQADFISTLKGLPPIKKKINVKWPNKNVVNSTTNMVKYGLRQAIDLNPDWEYQVWSDPEVDEYLERHLSPVDWQLVRDTGFAEKSDVWRLVLLYCEGGYYQDMDRIYNLPMASVLAPETKMLLPLGPADFAQDLMCTAPGNPIFKEALNLNLARRRALGTKADPARVLYLGPLTYFNAVTKVMFGVMLERGDKAQLDRAQELIESFSPIIKSKKESWCHLIVAEMPDCKFVSRAQLYKEYGIGIWADEEKARQTPGK